MIVDIKNKTPSTSIYLLINPLPTNKKQHPTSKYYLLGVVFQSSFSTKDIISLIILSQANQESQLKY